MPEKIKDIYFPEESADAHSVNKMLNYEFRGGNELWLHISDVKEDSLSEKLELLRSGFQYLAYLLKTHERFKDIEIISGTSWISTKNPRLIESLGFTIDNDAPGFEEAEKAYRSKRRYKNFETKDIEPSYAYISKEKFIELYHKDSDQNDSG